MSPGVIPANGDGQGKIKWKDQRSMITVVPLPLVPFFLRPVL